MAGNCKPNIKGLKKEAKFKVISVEGNKTKICGLFNQITANEWNTSNIYYWYNSNNFIEIEILSNKINIWRSGTNSWKNHCNPLKILKYKKGKYVDITDSITQIVTRIGNEEWEKTICNLPKGKYRFDCNGYRIDSEWYIEDITDITTLIKDDNNLYSLNSYDEENCKLLYLDINIIDGDTFIKHGFNIYDILNDRYIKNNILCKNIDIIDSNKFKLLIYKEEE